MSYIKKFLRRAIFFIPGAQAFWTRWINGKPGLHEFSGWGMTTNSFPPWIDPSDSLAKDFLHSHNNLVEAVKSNKFKLSQFKKTKNIEALLKGLMWRHFIVFWSARYAKSAEGLNIVECGVCDGLTIYFALSALENKHTAWLYDAWEGMKSDYMLDTEKDHLGDYAYLSIENTKNNLNDLNVRFVKGFIPESFKQTDTPSDVVWLHIDLNSSIPTTASLEEFYSKVSSGGVILFDDYAGRGFKDTKIAVDNFFSDKNGILFHSPTGQAIFFKH